MTVLKKCMFTGHHHLSFSCSHELEKDFIKKKMKSYGKFETGSKIMIKKDTIQSSDGSIHLYEDERKSL